VFERCDETVEIQMPAPREAGTREDPKP
jgi:hypothetical protein